MELRSALISLPFTQLPGTSSFFSQNIKNFQLYYMRIYRLLKGSLDLSKKPATKYIYIYIKIVILLLSSLRLKCDIAQAANYMWI